MPVLSVYNEFMPFSEIGGDMVRRIGSQHLYPVFQPLIEYCRDDNEKFNTMFFYLLHVYSKESKSIIIGQSVLDAKMRIAETLKMDSDMIKNCVHLKLQPFLDTVANYLRLQMSRPLEHLWMKRELYQQMQQSAMVVSGETVDFDQKKKNSDYADRLFDDINSWEQKLVQDTPGLKIAMDELRDLHIEKEGQQRLRVEDVLKTKVTNGEY